MCAVFEKWNVVFVDENVWLKWSSLLRQFISYMVDFLANIHIAGSRIYKIDDESTQVPNMFFSGGMKSPKLFLICLGPTFDMKSQKRKKWGLRSYQEIPEGQTLKRFGFGKKINVWKPWRGPRNSMHLIWSFVFPLQCCWEEFGARDSLHSLWNKWDFVGCVMTFNCWFLQIPGISEFSLSVIPSYFSGPIFCTGKKNAFPLNMAYCLGILRMNTDILTHLREWN